MIDRKEVTSLDRPPPPDDSFVYIPLEDVPDGLLDKLPDFKVIVKDKQGDRILPKERLGEVLKSMGREGSLIPRKSPSESTPQKAVLEDRDHQQSPRHFVNHRASSCPVLQHHSPQSHHSISRPLSDHHTPSHPTRGETYISQAGDRASSSTVPKHLSPPSPLCIPGISHPGSSRDHQALSPSIHVKTHRSPGDRANVCDTNLNMALTEQSDCQEQVSQTSNSGDFYNVSEQGLYSIHSLNNGGRRSGKDNPSFYAVGATMDTDPRHEDLSSFLETTPRKSTSHIPLLLRKVLRKDNCRHDIHERCQSEVQPQKRRIHQRQCEIANVRRARKQLFTEEYSNQDCDDNLHHARNRCCCDCPDSTDRHLPRGGLKRKYIECENEASFQFPVNSRGPYRRQMVFDGVAEHLLQDLPPSKRHRLEGTQREHTLSDCACSLMKSHFLRMTERAYLNIRRHDSTSGSFDQFRKELTETNSVLQESVRMLRSIQQICTHSIYQDE